jgi:hypothetical protein
VCFGVSGTAQRPDPTNPTLNPTPSTPDPPGELDVTYLDDELRISRGDKGNLFILVQSDPDALI